MSNQEKYNKIDVLYELFTMNKKFYETKDKDQFRKDVEAFNKKYVPLGREPIDAEKRIELLGY